MKEFLPVLGVMALCGWLTALPLLFTRKAPARVRLSLVLLPLAMLVCPLPLFCRKTVTVPVAELSVFPTVPAVMPLPAEPAVVLPAESPAFTAWGELAGALWAVGVLFCLLMQLAAAVSLRRHLSERQQVSGEIRAVYERLCDEMQIRFRPALAVAPAADTPLLTGLFRPVILLPEADYSDGELVMIFRHELTHHKQCHLFWQALARLAAALHWFHPLGHLLLRMLPQICEDACDETVAAKLNTEQRKDYGLVILRFAGRKTFGSCTALAAQRGKDPRAHMERRLQAVMNPKHISPGARLFALLTVSLLLLGSCGVSYAVAPEQVKEAPAASQDAGAESSPEPEISAPSKEVPADVPSEPEGEAVSEEESPSSDISPELEETPSEPVSEAPEYITVSDPETVPEPEEEPEFTHYPAQCWPLPGHTTITAEFGGSHDHHGIDISGENVAGAPVAAWRCGTVISAEYDSLYGNCILIDHGEGLCSFYAHCESLAVKEGDEVAIGQTIAAVGATGNATGPHLHFELQKDGTPVDPADYLPLHELCGYPKAKYFQTESHHEESSGHYQKDHH